MFHLLQRFFSYHRFRSSNKAIRVLTLSDTLFFSGMALVEVVFSVFIIQQIPGATVANLGIGNALFMLGILFTEPLFSKYYDSAQNAVVPFYGFLVGNLLKSAFRLLFVFINSVSMYYVVYFILGIVHSIEYPSYAKLFTKYLDKGFESFEWGYKDTIMSLGKVLAFVASGYIVILFGYNVLFIASSILMFVSGVVFPYLYKKELTA